MCVGGGGDRGGTIVFFVYICSLLLLGFVQELLTHDFFVMTIKFVRGKRSSIMCQFIFHGNCNISFVSIVEVRYQ